MSCLSGCLCGHHFCIFLCIKEPLPKRENEDIVARLISSIGQWKTRDPDKLLSQRLQFNINRNFNNA